MKVIALILSGGEGKRFDKNLPKQFFKINDKTILEICVQKFIESNLFDKIIVVTNKKFLQKTKLSLNNNTVKLVYGGKTRQQSVYNGLKSIKSMKPKYVVIHDSVRPFVTKDFLKRMILSLKQKDCVIPFLKIYDSIRKIDKQIYQNIDREKIKLIQTPQGFNFKKIYEAHKAFINKEYTDDSIIAYKNGCKINFIDGELLNIKITTKKDFNKIKRFYEENKKNNMVRVGNGFDVHKFTKGKFITLLGVKIPFNRSLEGHSDADVGIHSLVDAIFGAISKGDIGDHFPPSQKRWKNMNSEFFLKYAQKALDKDNQSINNLDITIICEKPKISLFKNRMKKNISKILKIDENIINIKATTTEKLGFLGREEGIACQSIVTISKK